MYRGRLKRFSKTATFMPFQSQRNCQICANGNMVCVDSCYHKNNSEQNNQSSYVAQCSLIRGICNVFFWDWNQSLYPRSYVAVQVRWDIKLRQRQRRRILLREGRCISCKSEKGFFFVLFQLWDKVALLIHEGKNEKAKSMASVCLVRSWYIWLQRLKRGQAEMEAFEKPTAGSVLFSSAMCTWGQV